VTANDMRREDVADAAERLAAAIGRRDIDAIRSLLAPGFTHRTHGGAATDADAFLHAIAQIPGEITSVRLEQTEVDLCPTGALVTGIQHAQVRVDGAVVDDRRRYIDWFVHDEGGWRIQAAVDLSS
jgi:hypothetical protein